MLAPRNTLHSTPTSAIDATARLSNLKQSDKVFDVGCGDGRVLIHLAKTTQCQNFVGIEIDADRAEEARRNVMLAKLGPNIHIAIRCENALETSFDNATVVFLYLTPRGMSLIQPLLMDAVARRRNEQSLLVADQNGPSGPILRVVTYTLQLKGEQYLKMERCSVDHQPGAAWPLYLYHFA